MATTIRAEKNLFSTRAFWVYVWRNGHWGHKLNFLGDCPNFRTTYPVYCQVAICHMATKIRAEMNLFSTRAFWVYVWRNGHCGHKLKLLGDCVNFRTTYPVYCQVAICQMATKIRAEKNLFSTRAFWVYVWRNGHWGHKLKLLGDCPNFRTTISGILPGCHTPYGNKNSGWKEFIFYQGLLSLRLEKWALGP
jgi:hypothetical protein